MKGSLSQGSFMEGCLLQGGSPWSGKYKCLRPCLAARPRNCAFGCAKRSLSPRTGFACPQDGICLDSLLTGPAIYKNACAPKALGSSVQGLVRRGLTKPNTKICPKAFFPTHPPKGVLYFTCGTLA